MKEIFNVLFRLKNEENMKYIESYNVQKVQIVSALIFAVEVFAVYLGIAGVKTAHFMELPVIFVLIAIGAVIECVSVPIILTGVFNIIDKLFLKITTDGEMYFRIAVLMFCIMPAVSQFFVMINVLTFNISLVSDIIQIVMWIYSIVFAVRYIKLMYREAKADNAVLKCD